MTNVRVLYKNESKIDKQAIQNLPGVFGQLFCGIDSSFLTDLRCWKSKILRVAVAVVKEK
ncbi:hypothetical protein [uncultured Trichococcus sp.]|uniref:hypothetical protein n=1 Tax=uncultured Trichococcus sp. TaxID=189665 RepID=UPI0029C7CB50|nr:hypothetical protein [uncultured Trichococcus sp.]